MKVVLQVCGDRVILAIQLQTWQGREMVMGAVDTRRFRVLL